MPTKLPGPTPGVESSVNGFLNSIVSWLRAGYPEGVPPTDTFPVLALLARRMSNARSRPSPMR